MALGYPLAPPPVVDEPSMYDAIGMAPPPAMQPVGPTGDIGLAPPPYAMPASAIQPPPASPEQTRAPAPVQVAPPPPELAPPPDGVDVTSGDMVPAKLAPETLPAGQMGGKNAPSGYDPEKQLIQDEADLVSQQQEAEAEGMKQAAQLHTDRIQMGRLMQVRDEKVLDDAMADVQKAQEEARAMRVDPGHWWSSRTTGQKIALVIGAAAGGFLSSDRGAPNDFMQQINQFIANDIHAQQANIANARDSAQAKQSLYGMMYQKFQNARVAYDMTTAQMLDAAKDQVAAYSAQFKSPMTQMEGKKMILALEQQRQAALASAIHQRGEDALKIVKAQDEHAKSVAETRKLNAETGKIGREGRDGGEKVVPVMVHGPKGSRQVTLPPEQAKLVQEAQKELDEAKKEQSAHADKKGAEYQTWVTRMHEKQRQAEDTMRAGGVPEDIIAAIGVGFTPGGIGGSEQIATPMTPQEQSTYFPNQGLAPPPHVDSTGNFSSLAGYAKSTGERKVEPKKTKTPYGGEAAPAGLPPYHSPGDR